MRLSIKRKILGSAIMTLAAAGLWPAFADDRDLFRETTDDPYIFVIFDVSGSMNWAPGTDGFAAATGDDPGSKLYQAKSALYRTLLDEDLNGVRWGFATYNRDAHRIYRKHWLYTPTSAPAWANRVPFPLPGDAKVFGDPCYDDSDSDTSCDFDSNTTLGSCNSVRDLANAESKGEVMTYPVLGDNPTPSSTTWQSAQWIRYQSTRYRVLWGLRAGTLGDPGIQVDVMLQEVNSSCTAIVSQETAELEFEPMFSEDETGRPLDGATGFIDWEIDSHVDNQGNPGGFFGALDSTATNTCAGWEPNTDLASDSAVGASLIYPSIQDPANRPDIFNRGDVIPLDWQDESVWPTTNRDLILARLAPNLATGASIPDFRIAPYFKNHPDTLKPVGTTGHLSLLPQYQDTPPLFGFGATPIGNSMDDFGSWIEQWFVTADSADGDQNLACRPITLLILTDGDETCFDDTDNNPATGTQDQEGDWNPCTVATRLRTKDDVRTFVVGFGVQDSPDNFLSCIANNGGTGPTDHNGDGLEDGPGVLFPEDEDSLVASLRQIVLSVKSGRRTFTSASSPQSQVSVADTTFVASFEPTTGTAIWPGRLDAYLKPIPLISKDLEGGPQLVPDRDRICTATNDASCRLWDAGEQLLLQASPNAANGNYNLGSGANQRRVYWSKPIAGTAISQRDLFDRPANDTEWDLLLKDLGLCNSDQSSAECSATVEKRQKGADALDFFHQIKTTPDPDDPTLTMNYLLGDIFHSDPVLVTAPNDQIYFSRDLFGSGVDPSPDFCSTSPAGYRCFAEQHRNRRRMLLAASNDGQLHAFDAGIMRGTCSSTNPDLIEGTYDTGTGHELFSFVPKTAREKLVRQSKQFAHDYTVDGPIRTGSVFIDAKFGDGVGPEWRTVAVAGVREGGTGLFALDITQPDRLQDCAGLSVLPVPNSGYVPSCSDTNCSRDSSAFADTIFPLALWEFRDSFDCSAGLVDEQCDDDQNGSPDLAATWSVPSLGLIRVVDQGVTVARSVAIFGGGMDAANKGLRFNTGGNFVYMVDIETGRAIYKQQVLGAVPSSIAALDLDQDGFIDTAYFGTDAGLVYKIDLRAPQILADQPSGARRVTAAEWQPFPLFDAGEEQIFFRPGVVFVPAEGQYALAFGTGDREDLWQEQTEPGRFYFLLDQFTIDGTVREARRIDFSGPNAFLPLGRADYQEIFPDDAALDHIDLVSHPTTEYGGWYLTLEETERVISHSFSLAGVTIFSTFIPQEDLSGIDGVCRRGGVSRAFVVQSNNADFLGEDERFTTFSDFLTQPYIDQGASSSSNGDDTGEAVGELGEREVRIINELKVLQPDACRFPGQTININSFSSQSGYRFIAPIPICVIQSNWKDL